MRHVTNPDYVTLPASDERWAFGGLEFSPNNNWGISAPGFARFRYNTVTNHLEVSVNAGSYEQIGTGIDYDTFRAQLTWYINSDTGDDGYDGLTDVTALRTFDEFRRRHGGVLGSNAVVNVYLDGAGGVFTGDINVDMQIKPAPSVEALNIYGTSTSVYSGSVTTYQAMNRALSQEPIITDAAIPTSWTASNAVGQRIELTSGTYDGLSAWTFKDLGTKKVRCTIFKKNGVVADGEPSLNDTFIVYSMTGIVGTISVNCGSGGFVRFYNCSFDAAATYTIWTTSGLVRFYDCKFFGGASVNNYGAEVTLYNCYFNGWIEGRNGRLAVNYGCCVGPGSKLLSYTSHFLSIVGPYFFQGDGAELYIGHSGLSGVTKDIVFLENTTSISIFCELGSKVNSYGGYLWGTGNTAAYAIYMLEDSAFYVDNLPDIDGSATSDTKVGGDNKTFAEFNAGYIQAVNMARSIPF